MDETNPQRKARIIDELHEVSLRRDTARTPVGRFIGSLQIARRQRALTNIEQMQDSEYFGNTGIPIRLEDIEDIG